MSADQTLTGFAPDIVLRAENAVLGSILLDPDAIVSVRDVLRPEMFYFGRNRAIYESLIALDDAGEPIDPVSVRWWMEKNGGDDVPFDVINNLVEAVPSALSIDSYAHSVVDAYRARELERILSQAAGRLYERDGGDVDSIQAWINDRLLENDGTAGDVGFIGESVDDVVSSVYQVADARANGLQIGIGFKLRALDKLIGGLRSGDLCVVAARPGMGKTTLALQTALEVARDGGLVVIYSLEMGRDQLILKLVSRLTGVPYNRLRAGDIYEDERGFIATARDKLRGLPIIIVDDVFDIEDIAANARRIAMRHGDPALIVVDYIQLAGSTDRRLGSSQNALVSHISRSLKTLARQVGCPIMALSQLNRGVESRADKRPHLADLRDSGAVEQDADSVLFIYREGYYDAACEAPNVMELILRKNRHGATGTASAFFNMESGRIADIVK